MAYDLNTRGLSDFRLRADRVNRVVRDPLEGIVGNGNTVFRSRFKPVSGVPTPVVYTSGSLSADVYELDSETGTVVFDAAPAVQPTMTYHWSNMTDAEVIGHLFSGFHEMESRWPRNFKLIDGTGNEVLYPEESEQIYVVNQAGGDPPCGTVTFSTSAAERNLLVLCARYMYLASKLDSYAEHAFDFREDRGLSVSKSRVPQNLALALTQADGALKNAIRAAQAAYYTEGVGTAILQPGTIEYFEDYEWQTKSRDEGYRTTYAGQ